MSKAPSTYGILNKCNNNGIKTLAQWEESKRQWTDSKANKTAPAIPTRTNKTSGNIFLQRLAEEQAKELAKEQSKGIM